MDELAGQRVELGGEAADFVLQAVSACAQFDLEGAQIDRAAAGERAGERVVQRPPLRARGRVGDVAHAALEQGEMAGQVGACGLQAFGRVDLVEPVDEEGERMHGEGELVHALEGVEVEIEQAVARGVAVGVAVGVGRRGLRRWGRSRG